MRSKRPSRAGCPSSSLRSTSAATCTRTRAGATAATRSSRWWRRRRQLGYEYFAITDHSERSAASRTLARGDVARQAAEIEAARESMPGIEVLHGVEVDIMPDGSLDFDDALLAGFDIVLASLHDDAGHGGPRLLDRYLRAMEHPLVNVITHPANRTPGGYDGYDLDYDRLFDAAAATGTAMEVDGSPGHLDLDGALARRAVSRGVTLVVDSDGHRTDFLGRQLQFGVGTARRGWVEPRHVLEYPGNRGSSGLRGRETRPPLSRLRLWPCACLHSRRAKVALPAQPRAHR